MEDSNGNLFPGEVVGFRDSTVLSMPLDKTQGIRFGDQHRDLGGAPSLRVGPELLGRNRRAGQSTGSLGEYRATRTVPIDGTVPLPLSRVPISEPLTVGVRAIDGFVACGRGQRVGIFGGSGVGKTTLVGMMTRATAADLTVLALVGERGREVGDFLKALGEKGAGDPWWWLQRPISHLCCAPRALAATRRRRVISPPAENTFCWCLIRLLDSRWRSVKLVWLLVNLHGEGYTPSVLAMMATAH